MDAVATADGRGSGRRRRRALSRAPLVPQSYVQGLISTSKESCVFGVTGSVEPSRPN